MNRLVTNAFNGPRAAENFLAETRVVVSPQSAPTQHSTGYRWLWAFIALCGVGGAIWLFEWQTVKWLSVASIVYILWKASSYELWKHEHEAIDNPHEDHYGDAAAQEVNSGRIL